MISIAENMGKGNPYISLMRIKIKIETVMLENGMELPQRKLKVKLLYDPATPIRAYCQRK